MALNLNVVGRKFGPFTKAYDWKDVALYAMGVGAGFDELAYVYEKDLKVIPSFGVTATYDPVVFAYYLSELAVNPAGLLHGEHELIMHNPIPPQGGLWSTTGQITDIYDKGEGRGALVISKLETFHSDGQKLFTNIATLFARLDGGFGGEDAPKTTVGFPDREPDFEELAHPSPDQPLFYRLSGDVFPLHVDPEFARVSGYERPIMHGLCTHGYACRAVIKHLFPGEPERLLRFRNRFSGVLYPGAPIKTQIWKTAEGRALFKTLNADTGEVVIDRGLVEWMSREEMVRRAETGTIRFDDRVAVVTGAGRGLGRAYALELAKRGAKVVVNDLGGARDGTGASTSAADAVVKEIVDAGGEAVANYDSVATVEGGENIVKCALERYGKVDILINNAGILRDKTLAKMTPEMWKDVLAVHLDGAYNVTRPAIITMRENQYGRIIMTTSGSGLYGNFGQTNYSSAKMGVVGLMNTLKLEGSKYDIKVNTVAPFAATRLSEDVMPPDLLERLKPEFVVPLVLYLCAEQCPVSGGVYSAGLGHYSRSSVLFGPGMWLGREGDVPTPEAVVANWERVKSLGGAQACSDANAALMNVLVSPRPDAASPEGVAAEGVLIGPHADARMNVKSVFERMPDFFQPEAAKGVDVTFQFSISGSGGGDWHVHVKDGACTVNEGVHSSPTTTLKMEDGDFLELIAGRLPPMQAFTSGKLRIEGDLMKSQLIEKLFKFS